MTRRVHLAVVHKRYLDMILAGTKAAEARLTKTRREPYTSLQAGETIYFKQSGGPIRARARAARVHRFELTSPRDIQRLRRRFEASLGGPSDYWNDKADARYATIIELADIEPVDDTPAWYHPHNTRSAWRIFHVEQRNN